MKGRSGALDGFCKAEAGLNSQPVSIKSFDGRGDMKGINTRPYSMSKVGAGKLALALVLSLFSIQYIWGAIVCLCERRSQYQAGTASCEQHCSPVQSSDHTEGLNARSPVATSGRVIAAHVLRNNAWPIHGSMCCRNIPQEERAIAIVSVQPSTAITDNPLRVEIEKPVALAFPGVTDHVRSRPLYLALSCLLI